MVEYIVKIAKTISSNCEARNMGEALKLLPALAEELNRLDPRDFLPDAHYDFVVMRVEVRKWAGITVLNSGAEAITITKVMKLVVDILAKYGGDGSHAMVRSFSFVKDDALRQIIERDYHELRLNVYPSGAWKATVVLAGSILEALLFDQLTTDPAMRIRAETSAKILKSQGKVKNLAVEKWKLFDLINIAASIDVLPEKRVNSIDQVLRDYRNFIHPKVEIRAQHQCMEAEAMMAVGALEGVCNFFE